MDIYMSSTSHIDVLSRKVCGILVHLSRVKDHFDNDTRVQVVQSLVLSVINYCIKVWGATYTTHLEKVQKLQNFAARVAISGVRKYDHITPALKQLEWIRIKDRYTYEICIFVYKILNNEYPNWLYNFSTVGKNRNIVTRQNADIQINNFRTELGARAMSIRGPSCWIG